MVKPLAASESAPNPTASHRQDRARACNSAGTLKIATRTTRSKRETLETEFIVPGMVEM